MRNRSAGRNKKPESRTLAGARDRARWRSPVNLGPGGPRPRSLRSLRAGAWRTAPVEHPERLHSTGSFLAISVAARWLLRVERLLALVCSLPRPAAFLALSPSSCLVWLSQAVVRLARVISGRGGARAVGGSCLAISGGTSLVPRSDCLRRPPSRYAPSVLDQCWI